MKSRVALEPGSDLWMLMGGIVVDDQMQIEPGRGFAFDLAQEFQPFLMAMSWQALADDGAVQPGLLDDLWSGTLYFMAVMGMLASRLTNQEI